MAEIADLKPCPFCGGNKLHAFDNAVHCEECDASGPDLGHCVGIKCRHEAMSVWNTRPLDAKDKRIAELQAALAPFAEASKDFDAECLDQWDIWEHPAALNITVGDLRRALSARLPNKEDRNG